MAHSPHTLRTHIELDAELIGTFCLDRGVAPPHDDRDFDAMERPLGLRVRR